MVPIQFVLSAPLCIWDYRAQSAQAFLQYIEASFLLQRLLALPIDFSESEAHHPINILQAGRSEMNFKYTPKFSKVGVP